ncbi:hypothetical protein E0W45_12155 [Neisseria meningitidis]|uniref:Uncharacterized protein n=1 Tax=Neisseria meningitidis serogroup B (strain ATCC BAA-335 / MC58) TaxID=122586 RepID=Q9JY26_NEIMB|nr:hypothetical protein NMB1776 [Neisseria meningitidis MC58]AVI44679.1 hypothetical protein A6J49_13175 [Neisseria meningitidis]MBG8583819.1 hypothetical protein [Neisseria meningitidis]MBG8614909.1 hypothetical protein [Neisseria meningitidis]MBG8624765.1 hypothetical protein [Neisseria meningitidis]
MPWKISTTTNLTPVPSANLSALPTTRCTTPPPTP